MAEALIWILLSVLLPVILAIAVVIFVYGLINYYVLGPGDEGRKEVGRQNILKANALFAVVLISYLVIQGLVSLFGAATGGDINFIKQSDVLNVPDVPSGVR